MSTYRFICTLTISLLCVALFAQKADTKQEPKEEVPLYNGLSLSVDLLGPIMRAASSSSNMQVAARVNLKDKFFPVLEAGIGTCDRRGADNDNRFKTTAPYFLVGMDYNVNKKHNGNRLFGGARVGVSVFDFDFTNSGFVDPIWGSDQTLAVSGQRADAEWLDLVVGLETRLWRFISLGYSLRYRFMIHMGGTQFGDPYYIPGFGRSNAPFGGTIDLRFNLGNKLPNVKKLFQRKKKANDNDDDDDGAIINNEQE